METTDDKPASDGIRWARVNAIKRAISEGRFHIDATAIADRMLEAARADIRARPKQR